MVQFVVNLFCLPVLFQKSPQNSLSSHPEHFCRHSCLPCALPLTEPSMSSLALGLGVESCSVARMDNNLALADNTVLDELFDAES